MPNPRSLDFFGTFLRTVQGDAKKAGDRITCLRCCGVGYTREGLTSDYPVECARCQGTGFQTARGRGA